jgi:hypothetical protein
MPIESTFGAMELAKLSKRDQLYEMMRPRDFIAAMTSPLFHSFASRPNSLSDTS